MYFDYMQRVGLLMGGVFGTLGILCLFGLVDVSIKNEPVAYFGMLAAGVSFLLIAFAFFVFVFLDYFQDKRFDDMAGMMKDGRR